MYRSSTGPGNRDHDGGEGRHEHGATTDAAPADDGGRTTPDEDAGDRTTPGEDAAAPPGCAPPDHAVPEGVERRGRAVVARRADPGEECGPDTAEIAALAAAAGYEPVGAVAQTRPADPGTELGDGKVEELAALVRATDADAAVVDGRLTPAQSVALGDRLPDGVEVLDRYRTVLAVFARGAGTERARLAVERARLRYELPRIRERTGLHVMSRRTEKGTPIQDVENRLAAIDRKLERLPTPAERHREQRRREGFDLIALAGYTNAGKSTLLHRLADDSSVADADPDHPDGTATASVADRLFETLETTTRRATLGGRPALVTDTVGFVDGLAHDLVESFSTTLDEAEAADCVVCVVDASDPPETVRRKVETATRALAGTGIDADGAVVALNKVDLLGEGELAPRLAAVREAVDPDGDPVALSATEGDGVGELRARVRAALPTERATLTLPYGDDAMGVVSWAHDHLDADVEYGEAIRLRVAGRPGVVDRLRARVDAVG